MPKLPDPAQKNPEEKKGHATNIIQRLRKQFPSAKIVLNFSNHWELLVAVILSAQCTDKKVNEVTEKLFMKYRTLEDYIKVSQEEFEKDIHSTGFFRAKAKNILAAAKMLKEKFGGKLPKTIAEMITLPGVARKTANVVLGNAYGIFEGIAVDTHVRRLSQRLGLSSQNNPVKIEPILAPIAIAGITNPPAQPEIKVKIVLIMRPKTSVEESKIPELASASLTVFMPPPIE